MSQMSSTECGRRNHKSSSAAKLRSSSADNVPIKVDVKCPPLNIVGRISCLAVTIHVVIDNAAPTARTLHSSALPGDPFIFGPPSLFFSSA
jgi:hypothetical protein